MFRPLRKFGLLALACSVVGVVEMSKTQPGDTPSDSVARHFETPAMAPVEVPAKNIHATASRPAMPDAEMHGSDAFLEVAHGAKAPLPAKPTPGPVQRPDLTCFLQNTVAHRPLVPPDTGCILAAHAFTMGTESATRWRSSNGDRIHRLGTFASSLAMRRGSRAS